MATEQPTTLWQRAQRGWPPDFPLVQFPNAPLLAYLAAAGVTRISSGNVHDAAWAISRMALTIWAYEELAHGSNWLRRTLGAAVLALIANGLAHQAS